MTSYLLATLHVLTYLHDSLSSFELLHIQESNLIPIEHQI